MKLKNTITKGFVFSSLLSTVLFAATSGSVSAQEHKDKVNPKLAKQAKITMAQAREIARNKVPSGKIEDAELEKEHGKLVYSFDIRNEKGTITEVQIDAKTGSIVSVEEENKAAEQKEKQQEKQEKAGRKKS